MKRNTCRAGFRRYTLHARTLHVSRFVFLRYTIIMLLRHYHRNAWIVSVNMGYGHERAAYGLEDLAYSGIITANNYPGIPSQDKELWARTRKIYETISRLQPVPFIGSAAFGIMDHFQKIPPFYPRRDLSAPNVQLKQIYRWIEHDDLGKHLVEKLSRKSIPLISTFFIPAFAAEVHGYPGDIYLVVCDADMSRAWVPLDPKKSRIKYFAPNGRVVERLKLYGVPEERIYLTGFPLPKTAIGGPEAAIAKKNLSARILNLDPNRIFMDKYERTLADALGPGWHRQKPRRPVTLTFSVGGTGAQKSLAVDALWSLRKDILKNRIRVFLEAGTKHEIAEYFLRAIHSFGLKSKLDVGVHVHAYHDRPSYFRAFTKTLRETDVLWTKPSELSFYTGLGLPIVIAPPIGSQEEFNLLWLQTVGGGLQQMDPRYANEWLFDWIASGGLARFAWNGYIEAPTHGSYRIESIMTKEKFSLATLPLIV